MTDLNLTKLTLSSLYASIKQIDPYGLNTAHKNVFVHCVNRMLQMRFDDGTFAFTRKDPMYFYVLNDSEMLHFNGEDIFVGDSDIAEVLADLLGSED